MLVYCKQIRKWNIFGWGFLLAKYGGFFFVIKAGAVQIRAYIYAHELSLVTGYAI